MPDGGCCCCCWGESEESEEGGFGVDVAIVAGGEECVGRFVDGLFDRSQTIVWPSRAVRFIEVLELEVDRGQDRDGSRDLETRPSSVQSEGM